MARTSIKYLIETYKCNTLVKIKSRLPFKVEKKDQNRYDRMYGLVFLKCVLKIPTTPRFILRTQVHTYSLNFRPKKNYLNPFNS